MLIRRAFLRWLVAAAVVLPIWLAVGWAVFGGGGWGPSGLVLVVPIAFIALGVIALLVWARPTVRAERAGVVDRRGRDRRMARLDHRHRLLRPSAPRSSASSPILLAIAAFWVALWQLVSDGARACRPP